jgi:hypothetical protein
MELYEEEREVFGYFLTHAPGYEALSSLAIRLAEQAHEEIKRPLTRAQLLRALDVHLAESDVFREAILAWSKLQVASTKDSAGSEDARN